MDWDEILRSNLENQSDLIRCEQWNKSHDTYDIADLHTLRSTLTTTHYDPILCLMPHRDLDETSRSDLSYKISRNTVGQGMDADRMLRWDDIYVGDRK
jgi:hypothetical protein